jgi:hypothetical protein
MLLKKSTFALLLLTLCFALPARAQFAIELSGSYDVQHGTYKLPTGTAFGEGSGFGYMGAISMDLIHFVGFTVGIKPAYEVQQFTSEQIDSLTMQTVANGGKEDVKINLLSLEPYIRYTIPGTDGLFIQASPSIKYVVSSTFHLTPGTGVPANEVTINPDTEVTLKNALYNAKGTIGYAFSLLGIGFEPSVSAAFPITDLSDISDAKNWSVTTLYLSLAVRL